MGYTSFFFFFQGTQADFLVTGMTAKNWNILGRMARFWVRIPASKKFTGVLDSYVIIISSWFFKTTNLI